MPLTKNLVEFCKEKVIDWYDLEEGTQARRKEKNMVELKVY